MTAERPESEREDAAPEFAASYERPQRRPNLRWMALLAVIAVSVIIVVLREEIAQLGALGYPGVFLVSLLGNATIILPAPSLALVFAAGSSLYPPLLGLSAGTGEALGELVGYAAGASGRGVIENQALYNRIRRWMERFGLLVIFALSAFPNPVFDLAGIAAGAMRVPVWQFLVACWLGKVLKTTAVAYAGAGAITFIERFLAP